MDKKSCDWIFKPSFENNGRLWIEIKEYEKDKSKIDMSIKTTVNLTITKPDGIKTIRVNKNSPPEKLDDNL